MSISQARMNQKIGRVAAIENMRQRLEHLACDLERGRAQDDFDHKSPTVERTCALETLSAVDELMVGLGFDERLSAHIARLMIGLTSVETGSRDSIFEPEKTAARPEIPPTILQFRGRVAAVQDLLMRNGRTEKEAAIFVLRNLSDAVIKTLRHSNDRREITWKTVKRWRDNAKQDARTSFLRQSYEDTAELISSYEKGGQTEKLAKMLLTRFSLHIDAFLPKSD